MTTFSFRLAVRRDFWWRLIAITVGLHGFYVIGSTLLDQLHYRGIANFSGVDIDIPLIIGIGLIYLSSQLMRRKQAAWLLAVIVYTFIIGIYGVQIEIAIEHRIWIQVIGKLVIPLLIIATLLLERPYFIVRSDIASFRYAIRLIIIVMVTAFIYGTAGFLLLDTHDFHREIGVGDAMHRTVDQFGLTTDAGVRPQTRRARLFVESLSFISVGAAGTAVIALFQPIRSRYKHRNDTWREAQALLLSHNSTSEDFFKLWPQDKEYRFSIDRQALLAFKAKAGVALVVGDPVGNRDSVDGLLEQFEDECFSNGWQPAFIHTMDDYSLAYMQRGYNLQKIGEEAVVDIHAFTSTVRHNKYFREVTNKFARRGYSNAVLEPPHSDDVITRLRIVSDEWLARPGRAERGFMLGYFSEAYMQQSVLVVAYDNNGVIQAFLNQVPSFDSQEATYDLLRHASKSLGNINDFLLLAFIEHLGKSPDLKTLNLGLCPLSGLQENTEPSVITNGLHFLYDNGNRFYSFNGLRRFKSKYQPRWRSRSIAYKGNPANFVRIITVLTRAMHINKRQLDK